MRRWAHLARLIEPRVDIVLQCRDIAESSVQSVGLRLSQLAFASSLQPVDC